MRDILLDDFVFHLNAMAFLGDDSLFDWTETRDKGLSFCFQERPNDLEGI